LITHKVFAFSFKFCKHITIEMCRNSDTFKYATFNKDYNNGK